MEPFEWAESNLDVGSPHELQERGVNVYFAPNIPPGRKVVDLADGRVDTFFEGEERPQARYLADYESLVEYCRKTGLPLVETNGLVTLQPAGRREAGDPLQHSSREVP